MTLLGQDGEPSFERDIRPMFRTKDRDSMIRAFDLFDHADVAEHAAAIAAALRSGQMPCDGPWPESQIERLQQWIDLGKPA